MKNVVLIFAFVLVSSVTALAQGSGFSFQGRLNDGTNPANGPYDLQFKLYDAIAGGGQIGSTLVRPSTGLVNGVFSVTLDFGNAAFNNPFAIFIEIAVKPGGSTNAYTILGPRQQLTVVPFAVRANNATNADNATNAVNAQTAINATNATSATNAINATNATVAANSLNLGGVSSVNYAQLNTVNTGDLRTNGALAITGNASQPLAARGFAKAMIEVYYDGTILRCYNGITNSSVGNCGFLVTQPLGDRAGVYRINFGFPTDNSFVSTAVKYEDGGSFAGNNRGINYRRFASTSIEFFIYSPVNPLDTIGDIFTVILF